MYTEKTNVVKPITWADIDALPIANDQMSEQEVRKLCLDYMTMMLHFFWTPSNQADLVSKGKVTKTFQEGQVYAGIPYVAGVMGNLYTAMEYYDEKTGVMDVSKGMETIGRWGNQCSGSTLWAWNRACTSLNYHSTTNMHETKGCIRVGPWQYTGGNTGNGEGYYAEGCGTDKICEENGEQVIYESYALTKPADGIVSSTQAHVQMIAAFPKVVRKEDGTIDGSMSFMYYTDQDGIYHSDLQSDGSHYEYVGGYRTEISFKALMKKHYVPFTFEELNDPEAIQKSVTALDYCGETVTIDQLATAKVISNYCISDITFVVKDENGEQVLRSLTPIYYKKTTANNRIARVYDALAECDLSDYADGKHTIEISARIGSGEKPVVYTGKLV